MSEQKRGPELHELLAVQGDLEANARRVITEGKDTFINRESHFEGRHRTLRMFKEQDQHLESAAEEHQALTTTTEAKLRYVEGPVGRFWDCLLQKERTNQDARADVTVGDAIIAKDIPAGALVAFERELKDYRALLDSLKTLPPGRKWIKDDSLAAADGSKGVYRDGFLDKKLKTVQTIGYKILVPGDAHHPAQVEKWKENEPVGEFTQETISGKVTPAEKSRLLSNVTTLIGAVKKARMRANRVLIVKTAVGKAFFDFIHQT